MKKVCVLLSTYNGEKYLRELLNSVLNQTDVDFQIFVRDDGSSDSTVEILKEYQEKGLLTLGDCGKNLGFSRSFSWLIDNAPYCDYYACCDQDDIWLPKKLSNAVSALSACDDIPALYNTNLIVVGKDLKEITRKSHIHRSANPKKPFAETVLQNMVYGCTVVFNNKLRELYKTIPSHLIFSHDYTLTGLATAFGKAVYEENPQILYRQHDNNTVGFYKGSLRNIIRTLKFAFHNDFKGFKYREALIYKYLFFDKLSDDNKLFIDLVTSYRFDKKKRKQLKRYIKQNIDNKFIKNYSLSLIRLKKL